MLEVVVVVMILAIAAIPFLQSFRSFSRSMHRSARHAAAIFVAQSILEQLRHRVSVTGDLEAEAMREAGAVVVADTGDAGGVSQYFARFQNLEGTDFHGITREDAPDLYLQLEHFRCDIEVRPASEIPVDSDGDGNSEDDMVEVGVTVRWQAPVGGERSTTLWTMFTTTRRGTP